MGIFWSMKKPNDQQMRQLEEWNLRPAALPNVRMYVPFSQVAEFESAGLPVDGGISIAPHEFSAEEWRLAFNLKSTEPAGVALEKTINRLSKAADGEAKQFSISDLIVGIKADEETADDVKDALVNILTIAAEWGVFGTEGTDIGDIVSPGKISIVDVSHLRATEAWSVRNFIVAIVARKIYHQRLIARKQEEIAKMGGEFVEESEWMTEEMKKQPKKGKSFPMVWLIVDEAHNFAPADAVTVSSGPLSTIAKQGREPGVSLVVMTQMPNKVHQDILSQCDLVFSHRLTSRDDLEALHSVMQTYMAKDLWQYINSLPRWPGAAIILDDNLEKVFTVQIRPRLSWHAGGTAVLV
jgi:DNA helicase HerA-like ATPase